MSFFQRILILLVILNSKIAFGEEISCREAYSMAVYSSSEHIIKPKINEDFIKKSAINYVRLKDPYNILLTTKEFEQAIQLIKNNSSEILKSIKLNNCTPYLKVNDFILNKQKNLSSLIAKANKNPVEHKEYIIGFERPVNKAETYKILQKLAFDLKKEGRGDIFYLNNYFIEQDNYSTETLVLRSFLKTMDSFSDYIPEDFSRGFSNELSGNNYRVGFQSIIHPQGYEIISVDDNSPAKKNDLKKGDIILKINEKPLLGSTSDKKIINLVEEKEIVDFEILRDGEIKKISIKKESYYHESSMVSSSVKEVNGKKVLVIKVPVFYKSEESETAQDILAEYSKYKKIETVVLDLRNNPGGSLDSAVYVVSLFITNPLAVQIKTKDDIFPFNKTTQALINEPLVVLVNSFSASASEIVAGAIKDYGRGLVVGDSATYGKGSVQSVISSFKDLKKGLLKITTSLFFTPSGETTHLKGVSSDIKIPSPTDIKVIKTSEDGFYIPKIESAVPKVFQDISSIKKKSSQRIKNNELFSKIKDPDLKLDNDIILEEAIKISLDYKELKTKK